MKGISGIDHAVVVVRDLDRAAQTFTGLGFTLTPRGYHSFGSQNHCIMFGSDYIELLAVPKPHPWLEYYREFLARGEGLAALALATPDADAARAELVAAGIAADPPLALSRPVERGEARFRIVQLKAGGLFLCQHLTPELVWRPEWQSHANGASGLAAVALAEPRPFEGLPESIRWQSAPALYIRSGKPSSRKIHGVELVFV
ncbi:MAG TPA: VOC family protein [Burkholderiales bacterium]|nr:VOC family protein [Burkholderiales bacterium]